jgi:hypothetical protein
LVAEPEVMITLVNTRRRWEGKIKMDLKEIEWEAVDWIKLAQDGDHWRALVDTGSIKDEEFLTS